MALNCNKEIPGVTDYEGTDRRAGGPVLPLPHRPLPGRHHDAGPGAAQAPARRGGRQPRLQLPAHAHARGADARARVREDERALARARGPRRAHRRGRRDGARAAGRHRLHPGRVRGARARARSRRCSTATSRTRSTSCPRCREAGRREERDERPRRRAASPRRSSRSTPSTSPGERFPYQEDIALVEDIDLEAATPGQDINWLEDIELLEEEGMPAVFDRYSNSFLKIYFDDPRGPRERDRAQGADRAPPVGQLLRHPAEGAAHASSRSPSSARGSRARARSATDWQPPVLEGWEPPLH